MSGANKNVELPEEFCVDAILKHDGFLITLVNDDKFSINKVTQRFLWNGHSYLPNHAVFSHIEKNKKDAIRIFFDEEYVQLMKNARRNKKFKATLLLTEKKNEYEGLKRIYSEPPS